jgi:hypothetical protein
MFSKNEFFFATQTKNLTTSVIKLPFQVFLFILFFMKHNLVKLNENKIATILHSMVASLFATLLIFCYSI